MANRKSPKSSTSKKKSGSPQTFDFDVFGELLSESEKFCKVMNLPKDLIMQIARTDSDWSFILKVDALIETASKEIVRHGLRFKFKNQVIQNNTLGDFVDSLPMNGKTSLLVLLDAAGIPTEELGFIEHIRKLRNAYAHDIRNVDLRLIDLISKRKDKSQLIKHLSSIRKYDEADLIQSFGKDPRFFRFLIIGATLRVLFYAYHLAINPVATRPRQIGYR